jgi:hypothetical protein
MCDQLAGLWHRPDRWPVWGGRRWRDPSPRPLIVLERFGQPGFDLIDTRQIGRVGGQEFRYRLLRPKTELPDHLFWTPAHALPKGHGFTGIVPGLRHQAKSDVVGFRFLFSIERQRYFDSCAPPHDAATHARLRAPSPSPARHRLSYV